MADLGVLQVKVQPDLTGFGSQVSSAMASIGSTMTRTMATIGRDMLSVGRAAATAGGLATAGMATIGLRTAASLEQAELQFKVLLGSATEAKERVADLFEFARVTPFEAEEVIKASRTMQIFGGDALATQQNLELVGDAAAGVGASFDEVSFWVSRAYGLLQAGQPWGEAALRLQELGVLSGDARLEIEKMADAGASSSDQWAVFTEDLARYSGAMEDLQLTFSGLSATLKDTASIGLAQVFQPAFVAVKDLMLALRDVSDTQAFSTFISGMSVIMSPLAQVIQLVADGVREFGRTISSADVLGAMSQVAGLMDAVATNAVAFYGALEPIIPILGGVAAAFTATYLAGIPLVGLLFPQNFSAITGALLGFVGASESARDALKSLGGVLLEAAQDALPRMKGSFEGIVSALEVGFAGALRGIEPGLDWLVREALPALADIAAELAEPLSRVVSELARLASGVITEVGPVLLAVADGLGAIVGAGLSVIADGLGILADNAEIAGPAIAGLAAAFAAFKISRWLGQLDLAKTAFSGVMRAAQEFRVQMSLAPAGTGFFTQISGAAQGTMSVLGSLKGSLVGLGIGAALAGGVALLTTHFQNQAKEARIDREQVDDLAQAYLDLGESARTTTQWLADQIRNNDELAESEQNRLRTLADLAGGTDELGAALEENSSTFDDLKDSITDYAQSEAGFTAAQQRIIDESGLLDEVLAGNTMAVDQLRQALGEPVGTQGVISGQIATMQDNFTGLNGTLDEYGGKADKARTDSEALATEQEQASLAASNYQASIDNLKFALDRLSGANIDISDAQRRSAAAFTDLDAALAENGEAWALNTQQGQDNQAATASVRDAILTQVEALAASGMAAEDAAAAGQTMYDTLVNKVATGLGITTEQAKAYIEQLGLTPDDITTTAVMNATEAEASLFQWWTDLGLTPDDVPTAADFRKAQAEGSWRGWVNTLGLTPADANTLAQFLDNQALADAAAFNRTMDDLDGKEVNVRVALSTAWDRMYEAIFGPRGASQIAPQLSPAPMALLGAPVANEPALMPRVYRPAFPDVPIPGTSAQNQGATAEAAVVIREANFIEPTDFDVLLNRVNLALAAGRI